MSGGVHTSGPWEVQSPSLYREDNGLCIVGLRLDECGLPLETPTNSLVAVATQSPVEADEGDYERATANAHLIAAAPDLLASVIELLEPLERASAQMVAHGMAADERAEAVFDRARAAIAKALNQPNQEKDHG